MSRRIAVPICLSLAAALLAGCGTTGNPSGPAASVLAEAAPGKTSRLLDYFLRLRNLPPQDAARELEKARLRTVSEKSDFEILRYCLALLALGDDWHRAELLLEPLTRPARGRDAGIQALALLLHGNLAERKRLEGQVRRAEEKAELSDRRIEELKAIEKSMLQRGSETKENP